MITSNSHDDRRIPFSLWNFFLTLVSYPVFASPCRQYLMFLFKNYIHVLTCIHMRGLIFDNFEKINKNFTNNIV